MAYQIDRYDNTLLTRVEDGTIDQTTDLKFIGKNYAGYGEIQNENFLFLLENFSSANPPPRPISGQLWYDAANTQLKYYDGTKFRVAGGAEIGPTQPSGLGVGDFWWDTTNEQLYVYNGTSFVLVGPQGVGEGITAMVSLTVRDTLGVAIPIIAATIDDEIVYVISSQSFTPNSTDLPNFVRVQKGLTVKGANANGITSNQISDNDFMYFGTATDSIRLAGREADEYVLKSNAEFNGLVTFPDAGLAVGNDQDLKINIENDNKAVFANEIGTELRFKAKQEVGSNIVHSVSITAEGVIPAADSAYSLGSSTAKWSTVFANSFNGTSTQSDALKVTEGGAYLDAYITPPQTANPSSTESTIAARDTAGNLRAVLFQGTATTARYADLAEKYTTQENYAVGTVVAVCIHPDHEAELCTVSDIPLGVISENPAYLMNADAEGQAVALVGRVPVRVLGAVQKGDPVYSINDGLASSTGNGNLIGIALESNTEETEKLVECVLKL